MKTLAQNHHSKNKSFLSVWILMIVAITLLLPFTVFGADQKDIASKKYALRIAQKYCSNAYEIIEQDPAGSVAFWMGKKTSNVGPGTFSTTVHECLHAYDHALGRKKGTHPESGSYYQAFFVDHGKVIYVTRSNVFSSDVLDKKYFSKEVKKLSRYSTYVTGTASSNDRGIFGLMEEFNAYHHDNRAMLELLEGGEKMRMMGELSENMRSNNASSYYEFNIFIGGYLAFARKNQPATYQKLMNNKELRLAYTLIEKNFREVLTRIYANPKFAHHFPDWDGEQELLTPSLKKELDAFMLKGSELGEYETYANSLQYDPKTIFAGRNGRNDVVESVNFNENPFSESEAEEDPWNMDNIDWDSDEDDEDLWADDFIEENNDESGVFNETTSLIIEDRNTSQFYVVIKSFHSLNDLLNEQWTGQLPKSKNSGVVRENGVLRYYLGKFGNAEEANQMANRLRSRFRQVEVF